MVPCWISVTITSRLQKTLHPNRKGNSFHSFLGIKRFHEYLYGRKFTVINNHQPLKSTFSKSTVSCPSRIQKLSFFRLQKYQFVLKYWPGGTMSVSNARSRANIKNSKPEFDENSLISNKRLEQFKEETQKGNTL